jgi:hypothetical protein
MHMSISMLRVPCTAACHGALSRCRREGSLGGFLEGVSASVQPMGVGERAMERGGARWCERAKAVIVAQVVRERTSTRRQQAPRRPLATQPHDPPPTAPQSHLPSSHYCPPVTEPNPARPFSITRIPRGVAGVMQPEHPSILAPSRLNDRQRSGQGCSWSKRSGSCQVKGRLLVLALVLRCWVLGAGCWVLGLCPSRLLSVSLSVSVSHPAGRTSP